MATQPTLFLYDHPMSSYAQKIRMALRFKGLPFTKETPQDLGSGHPDSAFLSANPRMEVPALIHTATEETPFKIFDSTTIMMYLEEAFPTTPSMLPSHPRLRAEARMIEEICDTHYEAINWALGEITWFKRAESLPPQIAQNLKLAAEEQTRQIYAWLETKLSDDDDDDRLFFSGEGIGYADFCVAPILGRSVINRILPVKGSKLEAWYERVREIGCVKETFEEVLAAAPLMAGMGAEAWKKGAGRRREYRDHRLEFLVKNGGIGIVQKGVEDENIRFSWPHPAGKL